MPIKSTGTLSLDIDIKGEFRGSRPVSLSQYFRGGTRVPNVVTNNNVPISGNPISFSNFYNAANIFIVSYDIIGGGGGGGSGSRELSPRRGTFAPTGGTTSLTGPGINVQAPGGAGGQNHDPDLRKTAGTAGESSAFGTGGFGGPLRANAGGNASGFGAGGGGGAANDRTAINKNSGCGGRGGRAGVRRTGTFEVVLDSEKVFTLTIGARGGADRGGAYDGGNASPGYAVISFNNNTYTFIGNGTISIPSGAVTGG